MKQFIRNIFIRLFNKVFSAQMDVGTFALLRTISVRPSELNAALRFFHEQRASDRTMYLDNPEGLFENVKKLMHYEPSPSELEAVLDFYRKSKNAESSRYAGDLNGLLANAETLMHYEASLSELKALFKLYENYKRNPDLYEGIRELTAGHALCYSQEGEDLVLSRIFDGKKDGFYVDIGAHHPKRFSNTYYFYKMGWRGINVEPNCEAKKLFDDLRPRDINLDVAVANGEAENFFYVFEEPALNTFSKSLAGEYQKLGHTLLEEKRVKTRRLSSILEEHVNGDGQIDFMSIDVEDFELPVLESNDWTRFRPDILLVEILNFDINRAHHFPVHNFIVDKGYAVWAKTFNTVFYRIHKEAS